MSCAVSVSVKQICSHRVAVYTLPPDLSGLLWTSVSSVMGTLPLLAARARKMAWEDELEMLLDTSSSLT